jgi:hypothetical protein
MKTMEHLSAALAVLLTAILAAVRPAHPDAKRWRDPWSGWDPFATGYRDVAYPGEGDFWSPSRKTHRTETTLSAWERGLPRARRGQ